MKRMEETVEFGVLCSMFEAIVRCKKGALKRKHVRTFLEHVYNGQEHFSAMRLILPDLDKERANYGLREAVLAKFLADALGLSKESEDAKKLINWRKGGQRAGSNAGNFSMVASEVLCRRQKTAPGGLMIKEVNDLLDRLAAAQDKEEKTAVLAELINKTNAQEMRWIIMIILKDLKLGISEKTVFSEFHPDAEDYFNVTCDLKLVCEKLRDRSIRYKRQDIEVGKAVRPQLAARAANVEDAWKKMRGKDVVVECKFDGDRIQVHKNGNNLNFWSRTFNDHPEFKEAIGDVLCQRIIPEKCTLDGEMLVWDRVSQRFAEFGSNRGVAKAAKDGLDSDLQICYVAFDILYDGDSSVIHRPLRERQRLLQNAIRPLSGRLEVLIPAAGGLNAKHAVGDPRWSILATSPEEVEQFFQETIDNREEGVVLKDLDSKWEPSDRSGKWLKLKPDYVHSESDLDALIIGGYFGTGRRGGEVAQFLLGLAEPSEVGGYPTKFRSFCRVGTGLTDDEAEQLVHKLKPHFRRNHKSTKPPSCYVLTNSSKERPDVWIERPEKSVILQITSDIRTIRSEVFATPYSLRFPRIQRIRYDKPWYDCLDVQTLVDTVHAKSQNDGQAEGGNQFKYRARRAKQEKPERASLVPSHMLVTDVSHVKQATRIFKGLVFYVANTSSEYPVEKIHKLVVENGGTFSMNLSSTVTHAVAFEKKGLKYQASFMNGDVIHLSWLLDCMAQKVLLVVSPKYYLNMSDATKERLKGEVDEFGDFYCNEVDETDLTQIFENIDVNKQYHDIDRVNYYIKKYSPSPTWCLFSGCCVFFLRPLHSANENTLQVANLTLRRLALEVEMHEGTVSDKLTRSITHVVMYVPTESPVSFQIILRSASSEERRLLLSKRVKVVSHRWIEDSVNRSIYRHPADEEYDLRTGEVLLSDEEEEELVSKTSVPIKADSMVPITPDKRVVPRSLRKPATRRRALNLGRPSRRSKGTEEELPRVEAQKSGKEEHVEDDRAPTEITNKGTRNDPKAVEPFQLDDSASRTPEKRVLRVTRSRKKDKPSSGNERLPLKRRLIHDEGEASLTQPSDKALTGAEPFIPRMSTRLAEKRKAFESKREADTYKLECTAADLREEDQEEPVEASEFEGLQNTSSLKEPTGRDDSRLHFNDFDHQSPAIDDMINTLLPNYASSQQANLSQQTNRESALPSRSNSFFIKPTLAPQPTQGVLGSYSRPYLPSHCASEALQPVPDAPDNSDLFSSVHRLASSQDHLTGTVTVESSSQGLATYLPPTNNPEKKKRSFKDLVNQMLNGN